MRFNIFGAPGSGKSTTAAWLFSELKQKGHNVELVTEYIKTWVWEERQPSSYDQLYIFASQLRGEDRLTRRGVNLVTDSQLLMQLVYVKLGQLPFYDELLSVCQNFNVNNPSVNVFLKRTVPYQPFGRYNTAEEAADIDRRMVALLQEIEEPFVIADPQKDKALILSMAEFARKSGQAADAYPAHRAKRNVECVAS